MQPQDQVRRICHNKLERLSTSSAGPAFSLPIQDAADELSTVVLRNLEGRFQRHSYFRSEECPLTLDEYIERVMSYWLTERSRIRHLIEADHEEWRKLYDTLERAAARRLSRLGTTYAQSESPADLANRVCLKILKAQYPYDVAFDAWAGRILLNLISEQARSPDMLDRPHHSLDEPISRADDSSESLEGLVPDPKADSMLTAIEDRESLLRVIGQLSPLQRQVIVAQFFEGLDDEEMACRLGKTDDNIKLLRHRALVRLARLLGYPRVKEMPGRKRKDK